MNENLPDGWGGSTLEEVAQINGRDVAIRNLPDDLPVTFLPMAAVEAEQGVIVRPEVRPLKEVRKGFTPFSNGDVLFAKITPSMENGKAAIARNLQNGRGFGSTEFHVLRPKTNVMAEWLFHFIRQESFRKDAKAHFAGTAGQLRVPAGFLASYPIPIPPLPTQARIVAKIEELFTQLDAGVAALQRVQAGLKRYQASVLKAAVEGRLFDVPTPSARTDALPAGWRWMKVKDAGKVQLGRQRAPQHHQGTHMRPYLRVANVFEDRIDLSDVKEMNFTPEEYETYKLEYGDILLNEGQSPEFLGRPAMYKGELPGGCFQNTLIRFQAFDFVDRHFALVVFRHYMHAGRFAQESQITTNIAHLSAGRFSNVEFPVPPLAEQHRIVAEVERRLSDVQAVSRTVAAAQARAGRLRQAVLKAAFAGQLVKAQAHPLPMEGL